MKDDHTHHSCCDDANQKPTPFYKRLIFWTAVIVLGLYLGSFLIPALQSLRFPLVNYLQMMFWPIVLGLLVGGLIDYYVPQEYISKHLAKTHKRTVFYAAGLGFLMSACSHGILALSMELHRKGASHSAVISFLLASPWANLPITFLLIGFFGWKGFLIIFAALMVAISTGLIFQILDRYHLIEKSRHTIEVAKDFSIRKDIAMRMRAYHFTVGGTILDIQGVIKGAIKLADMVLGWILVGAILASLSSAFVPGHFMHRFLGPTVTGLLVTLVIATILEVCSEGTSPLAFEIYRQTGAFGNAFAFLMGGVVTDVTEVGLVWKNLGPRTAIWMLCITLPQVLILAWIFNH